MYLFIFVFCLGFFCKSVVEYIYNILEIKVKISNNALLIQDLWSLQMYTKILTSRS